jgi:hypothetical protein
MARMWQSPTAEMKMAHSDPLYAAIANRCRLQGVFFNTDHTGRAALAFKLTRQRDDWYRHELGAVEGASPLSTALAVAHAFTAFDTALLAQHSEYIERLATDALGESHFFLQNIEGQADALAELLTHVRA